MQSTITTHQQGYRYGLRQPGNILTIFTRSISSNVDLETIDDWLARKLEVTIEPQPDYVCKINDADAEKVGALVWRVLLLGRYLQQIAGIPVFDPGLVLDVRKHDKEPSQWQSRMVVPMLDGIPFKGIDHTYSSALKLMMLLQSQDHLSGTPITIYNVIQKKILPPLRSMITAGISTIPILQAAYRHRVPFRHIGSGIYQLGWGRKSHFMDRSSVDSDSVIGVKLTTNKLLAAGLIRTAGLPAPEHIPVNSREQAVLAADTLGWPLVVKPADKERGEGVTVSITDKEKLRAAYKNAASFSKQILVERQVHGICYRLLIANSNMLYAIRRGPRSVEGDGTHTVSELVDSANRMNKAKPSWLQEKHCPLDKQAQEAMSQAGFSPDSVPGKGIRVPLRTIESTAWGGHIEDVGELVHPDNREIAERAARLFGLCNAGVDIISSDITRPWYDNGAIINEVNYAPYFGGNDIAKSLIPVYLEKLMNGDGRIPVEIMVGSDKAVEEGLSRQESFIQKNVDCYLTSHNLTVNPSGEYVTFPFKSLFNRTAALLQNKRVEALVLVVQTDEFLKTGLPVDHFDRLTHIDNDIISWNDSEKKISLNARQELLELLHFFEQKENRF
jgi:cyanophycin synthetase